MAMVPNPKTSFDWKPDTPLHEAIGEAVGAASMCWQFPAGAGRFDSDRAAAIVDALEEFIHSKMLGV